MRLSMRIAGIPCLVDVTSYTPRLILGVTMPDREESISFTVLDRRGRPAPWLARKVTSEDEAEILEHYLETVDQIAFRNMEKNR